MQIVVAIGFINHSGTCPIVESTKYEYHGGTQHRQDTCTAGADIANPGFEDIPIERDMGQIVWLVDRMAMDCCA